MENSQKLENESVEEILKILYSNIKGYESSKE